MTVCIFFFSIVFAVELCTLVSNEKGCWTTINDTNYYTHKNCFKCVPLKKDSYYCYPSVYKLVNVTFTDDNNDSNKKTKEVYAVTKCIKTKTKALCTDNCKGNSNGLRYAE